MSKTTKRGLFIAFVAVLVIAVGAFAYLRAPQKLTRVLGMGADETPEYITFITRGADDNVVMLTIDEDYLLDDFWEVIQNAKVSRQGIFSEETDTIDGFKRHVDIKVVVEGEESPIFYYFYYDKNGILYLENAAGETVMYTVSGSPINLISMFEGLVERPW